MGEGKPKRATRRRGKPYRRVAGRILVAILAAPAAYMLAALIGSLVPVNNSWSEPNDGITIYLADNGIHTDIVMPAQVGSLDWREFIDPAGTGALFEENPEWVAFGTGEEKVYLETPTWWDIRPKTVWSALTGGRRVAHVEWARDPQSFAGRAIRLRPAEYRRLWSAIRADFERDESGRPVRINHAGYGCCDSFYRAGGRFSAFSTCNTWVADKLRLAGVETSLWPPFTKGLLWRYRRTDQST